MTTEVKRHLHGLATDPIRVIARDSLLSKKQVEEVSSLFSLHYPELCLEIAFMKASGDCDLTTSLREMEKSDFFTDTLDRALLRGDADLAVHSGKDLPHPIREGLIVAAVTKSISSRDAFVTRQGETLRSLPAGARVATSSQRRENAIRGQRSDLYFCDLRGAVDERLKLLLLDQVDGMVVAEAALLRLGTSVPSTLCYELLDEETVPLQGSLALVCRDDDQPLIALLGSLQNLSP